MTDGLASLVTGFWPALIANSPHLIDAFANTPRVSCPPAEEHRGRAAVQGYLASTHRWLVEQGAAWEPVATTQAPSRVVDEGLLVLQRAGRAVRLPMALVAEDAGDRIAWLRIYHSMWPLEGRHFVRPALLAARPDLLLSGAVAVYQDALARGDLAAIIAAFSPHGCAREPSGDPYVYCGRENLSRFYAALFADGGIRLDHCTVTDDGVACAIEYNALRWGRTALPPQAGVAVYERGPDGLLVAARIYDDVEPPVGE